METHQEPDCTVRGRKWFHDPKISLLVAAAFSAAAAMAFFPAPPSSALTAEAKIANKLSVNQKVDSLSSYVISVSQAKVTSQQSALKLTLSREQQMLTMHAQRVRIMHPSAHPAAASAPVTASAGCPVSGLSMGRVDEGVDFTGSSPVRAIGPGVVTLATASAGWPGGVFIAYHLTGGPWAGQYVYVAEDLSISVSAGQSVGPGQVIATAYGGGDGIETGWAASPGQWPIAAAYGHYTNGVPTSEGYSFQSVLRGLGC